MEPSAAYYAVIFTTELSDDQEGYAEAAARMLALAARQPGFLGVESARSALGITVSYWESEAAIASWKNHWEHALAREQGRRKWYKAFRLRVARVEREYGFGAFSEQP